MKIRRKHKYIIFKIDTDTEAIVIEKTGAKKATLEEFKVGTARPRSEGCLRGTRDVAGPRPTTTRVQTQTTRSRARPTTPLCRRDCRRPSLSRSAGTACTSTSTPRQTAGRPTRFFS